MPPPAHVLELIERFDRNRDAYKSPQYKETQLRREFLDPLFKALGWDIDNEQGYAEAYKDVIHEDAIKVAESTKATRGTADVDDEFLKTIESWRADLARNLALRNPKLTQRELNFAVQRIIDRIIFLRICEGRGIEDYGRLRALANGDRIYPRLAQLFEQADDRYNSGLFHFKKEKDRHETPDELTLSLDIDDKL